MAQLVIIPAVIAIIAIGVFALFGSLAASPDSLDDQLARLRQSSGMGGNLIAGTQDPRYKDRCVAAYHIAGMIESIQEPAERKKLSDELLNILNERVHADDAALLTYMVMAMGRLAESNAFPAVVAHADSRHSQVRQGVVGAILNWSDKDMDTARSALPVVTRLLNDTHEPVRTQAAAAMWKLARPGDDEAITGLRGAMGSFGRDPDGRDFTRTRWHAAISLAALGDDEGVAFVADTLLNREALAKISADVTGKTDQPMTAEEQERVIAMTLHYVLSMKDERIWKRIQSLADSDPSVNVRKAATQLLQQRREASPGS